MRTFIMKIKLIPLSLASAIALAGCVLPPPTQPAEVKNTLTTGQVQLTLKKDITSQSEVLEVFGSPNLVTLNSAGEEVWTYQRNATIATSNSSDAYGTVIFFGGSSRSSGLELSSRTMTLIIKFRKLNGVNVVSDFSSRSSSF